MQKYIFSPSSKAHLVYLIGTVGLALLTKHPKFLGFRFQSMWKVPESQWNFNFLHFFVLSFYFNTDLF